MPHCLLVALTDEQVRVAVARHHLEYCRLPHGLLLAGVLIARRAWCRLMLCQHSAASPALNLLCRLSGSQAHPAACWHRALGKLHAPMDGSISPQQHISSQHQVWLSTLPKVCGPRRTQLSTYNISVELSLARYRVFSCMQAVPTDSDNEQAGAGGAVPGIAPRQGPAGPAPASLRCQPAPAVQVSPEGCRQHLP